MACTYRRALQRHERDLRQQNQRSADVLLVSSQRMDSHRHVHRIVRTSCRPGPSALLCAWGRFMSAKWGKKQWSAAKIS
jgi:hypothetical protein